MKPQAVQPEGVVRPRAPYSPVVVSGDHVFTAGQVGLEHVVKVTAFLVDLGEFEEYNDVYRTFFSEPYPARTTVGAALPGTLRVEIEAVARLRE